MFAQDLNLNQKHIFFLYAIEHIYFHSRSVMVWIRLYPFDLGTRARVCVHYMRRVVVCSAPSTQHKNWIDDDHDFDDSLYYYYYFDTILLLHKHKCVMLYELLIQAFRCQKCLFMFRFTHQLFCQIYSILSACQRINTSKCIKASTLSSQHNPIQSNQRNVRAIEPNKGE